MTNLNIISADEGIRWTNEIERLNEETSRLLKDIGKTLQDVGSDADSEVVDTLVKWGGSMIIAADEIKRGLDELAGAIRQIIKIIDDTNDRGKSAIRHLIDSIGSDIDSGNWDHNPPYVMPTPEQKARGIYPM